MVRNTSRSMLLSSALVVYGERLRRHSGPLTHFPCSTVALATIPGNFPDTSTNRRVPIAHHLRFFMRWFAAAKKT